MTSAKLQPTIRILEKPDDMRAVSALQRRIWGNEAVVPYHLLLTASRNGGLVIGACMDAVLVGFVFGIPGLMSTPDGVEVRHWSDMLGVLPEYRDQGIGYRLKRAQWQMVRRQGLSLVTWTYDPLLSKNAYFNVVRLGAISNTYLRDYYGAMNDPLNVGLPSDRLQVELWVTSSRVVDRMSTRPRRQLDLAHYFAAGARIINPTHVGDDGHPHPPEEPWGDVPKPDTSAAPALYLLEIPADLQSIRNTDPELALAWRLHVRTLMEDLFARGYIVTDFVHLAGEHPRSFYVLSDGEKTLG